MPLLSSPTTSFRRILLGTLLLFGLASGVAAQERIGIRFPAGATGTTINGTVRGHDYVDYVLNARGGQVMTAALSVTGTNGYGTAYFNILPAGQDYGGPYIGSTDDDNRAEVVLPHDGDWAIRVYLMGNDRDTDKTVGFSLDVRIAAGGHNGASGGGSDAGLLPEEDFFVVNVATLNVRNAPRPSGALLGKVYRGTVLRNAGGCTLSDGAQWCNVQPASGGVQGWVAARFLTLPRPGTGNGGGGIASVTGVPANDVLNVRAGPGTGNPVTGALANGDRVRQLRCESYGSARWCEIEMMTDMRERGWVNARYLSR